VILNWWFVTFSLSAMPYRLLDPSTAAAAPATTAGDPLPSIGETLSTARTELFLELGSPGNAPNVLGGRLDRWLNWAYRSMMSSLKIKECFASVTRALVVDQPFYALPRAVASVRRVSVINAAIYSSGGRPLLPISEEQYTRLPDADAEPTNYFRYGRGDSRMLVVYPDPTYVRTIIIDFRIRPEDLTADNHSPILPQEFHEAWLLKARWRAFRSLRDKVNARIAKNDYLDAIREIESTDADEDGQLPAGVSFIKNPKHLVRIPLGDDNDD
jgi:hypothetical protein